MVNLGRRLTRLVSCAIESDSSPSGRASQKLNIQHFAIAPGWVETSMAREGMETRLPEILRDIPLAEWPNPNWHAASIAFC